MGDPPFSWMVYVFGKFENWMSLTGPHLAIPEAVVHHLSTGKNGWNMMELMMGADDNCLRKTK